MKKTHFPRIWTLAVASAVVLSLGGARAQAQAAVPSAETPGMIGGQTVGAGRLVLGAATGYPETQFRAIFGMGSNFDLGVFAGLTYGDRRVSGLRQNVGLDLGVPLRWTLFRMPKAAMALRVVPYFRIGQSAPALGFGGAIGPRFSIALPKIFSLIVGAEVKLGYGHYSFNNPFGTGKQGVNFFEGAAYAVLGLETFLKEKWFVNLELDGGGIFASNHQGGGGLFNAIVGFGYLLH